MLMILVTLLNDSADAANDSGDAANDSGDGAHDSVRCYVVLVILLLW